MTLEEFDRAMAAIMTAGLLLSPGGETAARKAIDAWDAWARACANIKIPPIVWRVRD